MIYNRYLKHYLSCKWCHLWIDHFDRKCNIEYIPMHFHDHQMVSPAVDQLRQVKFRDIPYSSMKFTFNGSDLNMWDLRWGSTRFNWL